MKIIKICLIIINLAFIGDLFPAAAAAGAGAGAGVNDALKSFVDAESSQYIPEGEAGFKKVLYLIHSPEYKKQKANGPVRNKNGRTLMYVAIKALRPDIVQMLLRNDENIHNINGNGLDAMQFILQIKDDHTLIPEAGTLLELLKKDPNIKKLDEQEQKKEKQIDYIIKLINDRILTGSSEERQLHARVALTRAEIPNQIRDLILKLL